MNEIIYLCANLDDLSTLKSEDEIIQGVFEYIDEIFSIIHPRNLIYMSIDGVAPKAKMHQERVSLYNYAKKHSSDNEQFTKCDIKPGTMFMSKLSDKLRSYIHDRMNSIPAWKSIIVILSDANVPGEGEHKTMDFIRSQKFSNSNTNHVLFSGDSDMVLLGLTMPSDNVRIMRRKTNKIEVYTFRDLKLLREEIKNEFIGDLKSIIDDWIFLCLLAGNDFLPNLPSIEFNQTEINNVIFDTYKEYIRKKDVYLIENMEPNLEYFKILLKHIGEIEEDKVMSLLERSQTATNYSLDEIRKQEPITNPSAIRFAPPSFQKSRNPTSSTESATHWQRQYYKDKFGFKGDQLKTKSTEVVQHYAEGLCWVLHYYYKGVPSWDWYYSYYYPPLASTFSNLENIPMNFNRNSKPLKPLEHMLAIFPSKYARYLPKNWQELISDMKSSIIDFYRSDPAIDAHGKRYEEQYIVKLPFVDEKCLFEALKSIDSTLSKEEEKRNRLDDDHLFIHSTNSCYQ
uniref:5-3 exoribonuclease 2 isoform 9-like protein n=1 Tax=Adineta vaga TaxID=104782 RepID=B3G4I9_ADIVA|nr:5-3 exoribonuclease 2 isoform 9-like protein [Adineta vaga]